MRLLNIAQSRFRLGFLGFGFFLAVISIFLLYIAFIIQLPYFTNLVWILGESYFNQIKWQINGSPNYVIQTDLLDISVLHGVNTVTVKNREIVVVEGDPKNAFPYAPEKYPPEDYFLITIEGMFQSANLCVNQPSLNYWLNDRFGNDPYDPKYIWLSCQFEYDPTYGYPTRVEIDCSNADMCARTIEVLEVKILPK
jgi:hypothetical protein